MEKTYAALYIPKKKAKKNKSHWKFINGIKRTISGSIKKTGISSGKFDITSLAKYIVSQPAAQFTAKYALSGLSDILAGQTVLNKTKRESFFSVFMPVLSKISYQLGYENISEFKQDITNSNNLNLSEFLNILTESTAFIINEESLNYSGYGDEIPIDVVESCQYTYSEKIAEHPIKGFLEKDIWLSDLGLVEINFVGHIKNPNGELVKTNRYMHKLGECMKNKSAVTLRIGKDVYENCLIEDMSPVITNIYELKLVMNLKYCYNGDNYKRSAFGGTILNPSSKNNTNYILTAEKFAGIFS